MAESFDPTELASEDVGSKLRDFKASKADKVQEGRFRPRHFGEFIGQKNLVDKLKLFTKAAKNREETLDHLLLSGPPGLGKTTLAHLIAGEMGGKLIETSGPALVRPGEIVAILTSLSEGDVLFIDEIHRIHKTVEESLYPAMEDFKVDIMLDPKGPSARSVRLDLAPFTLIGATTRTGLLSAPLRDRFGVLERIEFYPIKELEDIVLQVARQMSCEIRPEAASEVAARSRGTPRIAHRLLRRVRDYAQVYGNGVISLDLAKGALDVLAVDPKGLDFMDRRILEVFVDIFNGGPVGIEALAASLGEDLGTLEDVYEPYLLQIGFIARTPRGRVITRQGANHIGRTFQATTLFEF